MKQFTQTNLVPGNCWQTCVACILDVEPEELPPQVAAATGAWVPLYTNALNAYLETHHGLMYSELPDYQFGALMPREPGWMVLCGPTVRTETNGGVEHCIVGRFGEPIWDPHPSRDGLICVKRWGILAPLPERLRAWRASLDRAALGLLCVCRRCAS